MRTRFHLAVVVLGAALFLAGCAQSGVGSSTAGSSPAGSSASATASQATPASPAPSPAVSASTMVLTGQVEPGVEPHCLLLKDGGQTYQLMGGDPAVVKAGARVRVSGHVVDNVMSYCMQGKPFQITEAHAL